MRAEWLYSRAKSLLDFSVNQKSPFKPFCLKGLFFYAPVFTPNRIFATD